MVSVASRKIYRLLKITFTAFIIAAFIGCNTNTKKASDEETKSSLTMPVPKGQARIVFYRIDHALAQEHSHPSFYVNNSLYILIPNNCFNYYDVNPGEYLINMKSSTSREVEPTKVVLKENDVVYFKATTSAGSSVTTTAATLIATAGLFSVGLTHFSMTQEPADSAITDLQKLRYVYVVSKNKKTN